MQSQRGQRSFEAVIVGLLAVIAIGFLAGLFVSPVDWRAAAGGLVPRFDGAPTVLLAASMLGATVMPHAIYLHSSLARDRHGHHLDEKVVSRLLRVTRWDVFGALGIAGAVNIAMLLLAAASLSGQSGTSTIEGAYAAISGSLGPVIAAVFAIGLLASGFASASVGSYAGATIMSGLLTDPRSAAAAPGRHTDPGDRHSRGGVEPTWALVISQVS